jgi:hypothetical protein
MILGDIAQLIIALTSAAAFISSRRAARKASEAVAVSSANNLLGKKNKAAIEELHKSTNSRMDQLLEITRKFAEQGGIQIGIRQEQARISAKEPTGGSS